MQIELCKFQLRKTISYIGRKLKYFNRTIVSNILNVNFGQVSLNVLFVSKPVLSTSARKCILLGGMGISSSLIFDRKIYVLCYTVFFLIVNSVGHIGYPLFYRANI